VLLHALAVGSSLWDATRRDLEALGHHVLTPDQRGYGATPLGDAPETLDVCADDIARLLDGHGVDRAVLAGISMGGYVAMAFLRRHRHRVAGLALLSTRAEADTPEQRAERDAFAALVLTDRARPALIDAALPRMLGATTRATRPDVAARLRATITATAPEAIAWSQRAIAARPDSTPALRETHVPTLVLAGEEDELVTAAEARTLAAALPRARLLPLPGTGHLAPAENPDAVTAALADLLDTVTTAAASPP
jgi:pimeloyl-ACP methyl ester carboxylesterase